MEKVNDNPQMQIELKEDIAQGVYVNLALITHSSSEFIIDFVSALPGLPKPEVRSRVILTPENIKRLVYSLQENVANYERNFGIIRLPENKSNEDEDKNGKTFVPPLNGFKGEA